MAHLLLLLLLVIFLDALVKLLVHRIELPHHFHEGFLLLVDCWHDLGFVRYPRPLDFLSDDAFVPFFVFLSQLFRLASFLLGGKHQVVRSDPENIMEFVAHVVVLLLVATLMGFGRNGDQVGRRVAIILHGIPDHKWHRNSLGFESGWVGDRLMEELLQTFIFLIGGYGLLPPLPSHGWFLHFHLRFDQPAFEVFDSVAEGQAISLVESGEDDQAFAMVREVVEFGRGLEDMLEVLEFRGPFVCQGERVKIHLKIMVKFKFSLQNTKAKRVNIFNIMP